VDAEQARQALDGGAAGVVLPYIETVDQVKDLRGAVKLRPLKGQRLAAALATGRVEGEELAEYIRLGGEQRALVINIESQAAIDSLEAMLAPELGVDAVLIGPHDLSCNLGIRALSPITNVL
jgi:4-hydroxy-2-oxoheptanedioate aldolase